MITKMFKAVDRVDNNESLFAVCGNKMCVSGYSGASDSWLNQDTFGELNDWFIQDLDEARMINPVLVWES